MEKHLYNQLNNLNKNQKNKYRDNWGSALSYLSPKANIAGKIMDEAQVYNKVEKESKAL